MALSTLVTQITLQGVCIFKAYWLSIVLVLALLQLCYNRYGSPIRQYPGPILASFTRLWQVWVAWGGKAEEHYMNAHHRYGPIVRLGPNEISLSSPFAAIDLFKTGKGFTKTDFYTVFLPDGRKDVFTEIREPLHAEKKRFAVVPYSLASIQKHAPEIEHQERKFISKLDAFAGRVQQESVDLGSWLHYLAFDVGPKVLGQFAFSRPFGFLDAGNDLNGAITTISGSSYESGIIGQMPWLDFLTRRNPIWKILPKYKNKASMFLDAAAESLQQYQDPADPRKDVPCLLKSLLDAHRQNADKFTKDDVVAISMGAVAAGSDSTASTMQSFVWHVLSDPSIHERLSAEISQAHFSNSGVVGFKEAQDLPYFQACLKEAMRMKPAVGFNITRNVPPSGASINGTWIPGGTQVAVNAWVMHRDEEVFGADAKYFNPERWLKDGERAKVMERCMFQFGGGSHVCIGRHLALFEMNTVLPQLFRRYNMRLVNGKPLPHITGFFYIQSGLEVYIEQRVVA